MRRSYAWILIGVAAQCVMTQGWAQQQQQQQQQKIAGPSMDGTLEFATFGSGCFWCTEAVFQQMAGVESVRSGYAGGHIDKPTYESVCTGATGHAEVVQIEFDPKVISYKKLLELFWKSHDPTTLNRQGEDRGTQYRSVIFYHNEAQKELATTYKTKLDASGAYKNPIVTQIEPFTRWYVAEAYHQNYFQRHPSKAYCQAIIAPKIEKVRRVFSDDLSSQD